MWQKEKPIKERKPRTKTPNEALASLMRLCARAEKCEGTIFLQITLAFIKELCYNISKRYNKGESAHEYAA